MRTKRHAGRFDTLNGFIDVSLAGLTRADIACWLVLFRDTKPDGTARAAIVDIAHRAGVSRQKTGDALGRLRKRGLLVVVRKDGLNRGPSIYRVNGLAT